MALGSGGPRGLAHIGVIKALEEHQIPIDLIAGSSAGALIGGLYLALKSTAKLEAYVRSITYQDLTWMFLEHGSYSGLIGGHKIEQYLEKIIDGQTIESLPIPFAAVATDLATGTAVALEHGLLSHAIRASSSVPALIDTVHDHEQNLVDGGTSMPVPVPIVKTMGADYVIAVNLEVYPFSKTSDADHPPAVPDMGLAALHLLQFNLAKLICGGANCVITPDVAEISSLNLIKFVHGDEIIQKGYDAAQQMIPQIKKDLSI